MLQHLNAASIDVEVTSDGVTEETSGGSLTTQMSVGTEQTTVVSLQRSDHTFLTVDIHRSRCSTSSLGS